MILLIILVVIVIYIYLEFNPKVNIYSKSHLRTSEKIVALTFDDGPNEKSTPEVLKILRDESIKATFFVVGKNVRKNPIILKEIFHDGHLIGNHSDLHKYPFLKSSKVILSDLENNANSIYEVIKKKPKFYRPPFGLRTPWSARLIKKSGYFIVTWDDMTYDYFGLSKDMVTRNITKRVKPGSIIVLHDGHEGLARENLNYMSDALPEIIRRLKAKGYRFVTLNEMFNVSDYQSQ